MGKQGLEESVARAIRERREELGLSQDRLAVKARVARGTVRSVERGHLPSVRILSRLTRALGLVVVLRVEVQDGVQSGS